MDMKNVLKSGDATAEELLEQFKAQLAEAQAELEAEKAKEEAAKRAAEEAAAADELDEVRAELVEVILDYLMALGVVDEDDLDDDDVEKLTEALKAAEEEMKRYAQIMDMLKSLEAAKPTIKEAKAAHKPSEDEILAKFLKGIMQ